MDYAGAADIIFCHESLIKQENFTFNTTYSIKSATVTQYT